MKSKKIIISIILILIVLLIIIIIKRDKSDITKSISKGDKDKVVLIVNEEEISQLDVDFEKLYLENSNNENDKNKLEDNDDTIKNELIKNQVLLQEAKKNNIDIDEDEKNLVREMSKEEIKDLDKKMIKKLGITKEEYIEYLINKQIETRIKSKMYEKIISEINEGTLKVDDETINNYLNEYKSNEKISEKYTLLKKIYDSYLEYLIKNSDIKYE